MSPAEENMIKQQMRILGIPYGRLLRAIISTSRKLFIPKEYEKIAHSEVEIPLSHERYELTPQTVARIVRCLDLQGDEKIIQFGCGSGYLTAILAKLSSSVEIVEEYRDILKTIKNKLDLIRITNIVFHLSMKGHQAILEKFLRKNDFFDIILIGEETNLEMKDYLKCLSKRGKLFFFSEEYGYAKAVLIKRTVHNGLYQEISKFDIYRKIKKGHKNNNFQL